MNTRVRLSELLVEKQYDKVADVVEESLRARKSKTCAAEDSFVVRSILMGVICHLRFLAQFGEAAVPHMDSRGKWQGGDEEFFKMWMSLGAFGIDDAAMRKC